jgi:predicted O-linked N-acetylglucosamine transferase (SPINDLY family)
MISKNRFWLHFSFAYSIITSTSSSLSPQRLRTRGDSAWQRALDSKTAFEAATATRDANKFYFEAYKSSSDQLVAASCFYEAAYTSAVGSLIEEQPSRDEVSQVLRNELAFTAEKECEIGIIESIPPRICYGHSRISQLVALTLLDAKDLLLVSKAWAADRRVVYDGRVVTIRKSHSNELPIPKPRAIKMQVGFLSASFGDHPVGHHITPLLIHLNRSFFEVFCFFSPLQGRVDKDTSFLERNKMACDEWVELEGEEVGMSVPVIQHYASITKRSVDLISSFNLGVLITLDGFDKGNRMDILSLRPVPCILSFFGYLATTGADYIDGIISDNISIPFSDELNYSENFIVRHPVTFFGNNYWDLHPEVLQVDEMSANQHLTITGEINSVSDKSRFTFCSFSQLFKVTRETLNAWLSILNHTGNSSRLVLLGYPPTGMPNLQQYFQSKGIGHRVVFLPILPKHEHLLRKGQICNLGLDTFFYNGHTTVADLLWAGVPVLTYADTNSAMAGKAAASIIKAAGAPRLFYGAKSKEEYIQSAIDVFNAYRNKLSGLIDVETVHEFLWRPSKSSKLFQTELWVRGFEDVLREGVEQCRG